MPATEKVITNHLHVELIRALELALCDDSKEFVANKTKGGQFPFIALPLKEFEEQLDAARQLADPSRDVELVSKSLKFIDVGCGIGSKVFLAAVCGYQATGIEITKKYVDIARRLFTPTPSQWNYAMYRGEIIRGNALTHDYSPYDVIYFYWPLQDIKLQIALEKQIIKTAKPGAIILANGKQGGMSGERNEHPPIWCEPAVKYVGPKGYLQVIWQKMPAIR